MESKPTYAIARSYITHAFYPCPHSLAVSRAPVPLKTLFYWALVADNVLIVFILAKFDCESIQQHHENRVCAFSASVNCEKSGQRQGVLRESTSSDPGIW